MLSRCDEIPLGSAEARPFEVRVAFVEAHRTTFCDLQGIV
jgi:hypothetical protein